MEDYEHGSNAVTLVGSMASGFEFDHELYGERFYKIRLAVDRNSGTVDYIPVLVSDRLINVKDTYIGKCIHIKGQFRSYNKHDVDKNRLMLYVFALEVEVSDEGKSVNDVFLSGHLCKLPVYRETPMGRAITDIMLAVNRSYNKSDYIPCICWGRSAYYVRGLNIGDCVRLAGRIQSRQYIKGGETKIAYEVSVHIVEV